MSYHNNCSNIALPHRHHHTTSMPTRCCGPNPPYQHSHTISANVSFLTTTKATINQQQQQSCSSPFSFSSPSTFTDNIASAAVPNTTAGMISESYVRSFKLPLVPTATTTIAIQWWICINMFYTSIDILNRPKIFAFYRHPTGNDIMINMDFLNINAVMQQQLPLRRMIDPPMPAFFPRTIKVSEPMMLASLQQQLGVS
jgi:hypothetical protein